MTQDVRSRIYEGFSRVRLKIELRRALLWSPFLIVGLAGAVAIFVYFVTQISETLGRSTYTVRFAVQNDFGVFPGFDDVRFRGVPAGTITEVERKGSRLVLVTKIREDAGTVYRDARAQIRPITPLNDVYLDIVDPGTPAAGRPDPDRPLDESQTESMVTVPEVLDVFQPDVRANAARLLDQLGNGLADRGAKLRAAIIQLGPFLREATELTRQLSIREQATQRLVRNARVLFTELRQRERLLRRLVGTGAATLGTLHRSSGDIDGTLRELAPTFIELRQTLSAVRGVVDSVDTALTSLNPVADRLPSALTSLRRLDTALGPAVSRLGPPVRRLTPWVDQLDKVARFLPPIGAALRPQAPVLDRLTQRLVDCEAGVIGFFQWDVSLLKFGDANGPVPRGNLALGIPAVGLPGEPLREPEQACTPGPVVRHLPDEEDFH